MSEKVVVKNGSSVSILGLLGVVFVTLKLLGITAVAGWSWWLVTLPFWIGLAIVLGVIAVGAMAVGIAALLSK